MTGDLEPPASGTHVMQGDPAPEGLQAGGAGWHAGGRMLGCTGHRQNLGPGGTEGGWLVCAEAGGGLQR